MKTKEVQPISREQQLRVDEFERTYWRTTLKRMLQDWRLYLMLIPLLLVFLFWRYFPMYNLTQAFKLYDSNKLGSGEPMEYVGLYWFQQLISGSYSTEFWPAFRNTFVMSFYGLLFGFPTPILLALFFSEIKSNVVRSAVQICSYLPHFVSVVVITSLVTLLLQQKTDTAPAGVLATILGWRVRIVLFGKNILSFSPFFLVSHEAAVDKGLLHTSEWFRSIYQISGIWTEAGYGSIVYFAAIIGISPTSYEAARMDGATKMQQIRSVVLPGILSTVVIMLIMRLGHLMSVGYEKVLLLQTNENNSTSEIVATWVIKQGGMGDGAGGGDIGVSVGSAADMINAVISMLLVTGANMISKRASNTSLY